MTEEIRVGDVWRARGPKHIPEADRRRVRLLGYEIYADQVWAAPLARRVGQQHEVTFRGTTLRSRYELVERDGQPVGGDR